MSLSLSLARSQIPFLGNELSYGKFHWQGSEDGLQPTALKEFSSTLHKKEIFFTTTRKGLEVPPSLLIHFKNLRPASTWLLHCEALKQEPNWAMPMLWILKQLLFGSVSLYSSSWLQTPYVTQTSFKLLHSLLRFPKKDHRHMTPYLAQYRCSDKNLLCNNG